jgi:hypothetical protein
MVIEVNEYLLNRLSEVNVLDIEIEGDLVEPTYFFYISSTTYNKLVDEFFPSADLLQGLVKTYNGCLFKIELKDNKVEILIGFELGDHTLTMVFDDEYKLVDIKFYTLVEEVGIYKVCYKIKLSSISSLYYNYEVNGIWTSYAPPISMYTEVFSATKYTIADKLRHLRKEYTKHKDVPSVHFDDVMVISNIKDYQDVLTYAGSNLNIKPTINKLLQLLIIEEYNEFIKQHSINNNY